MPDIQDMVKEKLKELGYSGLYNEYGCGCSIDDLMPCSEPSSNYEAGYKVPCDCEENCEFHIVKEKK